MDPTRQHPAPLPADQLLTRIGLPLGRVDVADQLDRVEFGPRMIEDFRPISESLEWSLSELQWDAQGVVPFLENSVPYTVNNNGELSHKAARVLLASCEETSTSVDLLLFELGAGTGLFARSLLDQFRDLCEDRGLDYYDRVRFDVTDLSPRTVEQWQERGVFAPHAARVRLGVCDARSPGIVRGLDGARQELSGLRAIFCNYILDSLPCTIVRSGERGIEEFRVRTHLTADLARVARSTDLGLGEIRRLASSPDPAQKRRLLSLLKLFEFETTFDRPERLPPFAEEAVAFAAGLGLERITLNHGAALCLGEAIRLLGPAGFVLLNDYGATATEHLRRPTRPSGSARPRPWD